MFEYIQLDFDLYGLDNQPISGWVVETLGQIPQKGDSFTSVSYTHLSLGMAIVAPSGTVSPFFTLAE